MDNSTVRKWLIYAMMTAIVIGAGMFGLNQVMKFYYNSELLQSPCNLCVKLNPEIDKECFIKKEYIGQQSHDGIIYNITLEPYQTSGASP